MTALALTSLLAWIYLAFLHGKFWLPLVDEEAPEPEIWPSVDIVVPARDEAGILPRSLPSLLSQNYPGAWRVILVDDHSADGTGEIARQLAFNMNRDHKLVVVPAPELPTGWSGKVAAMQAGVSAGSSEYILFTDADIEHPPHSMRRLVARAFNDRLDLVSLMVKLHCVTFAEKLLIPAFVFFFAMLYPFRRVNNPYSNAAAAAGGVMLVRRKALLNAGGLETIKSEIIDDCALARAIKRRGGLEGDPGSIRLTLARDVSSLRSYSSMRGIMNMISRTAFTQLRHSAPMLALTVAGLALLFLAPVILPLLANQKAALTGLVTWLLMSALYLPTVRFYRLEALWALSLPAAAAVYITATIDSARLYWQGRGGQWKGRAQAR